jgi:hypothetical protein
MTPLLEVKQQNNLIKTDITGSGQPPLKFCIKNHIEVAQ